MRAEHGERSGVSDVNEHYSYHRSHRSGDAVASLRAIIVHIRGVDDADRSGGIA